MQATSELIPIFPLNITLLPGEKVSLHIFEPRYRELFSEMKNAQIKEIGILFTKNGNRSQSGCTASLIKISKEYRDGTSDVVIKGERIFISKKYYPFFPGKLYPGSDVVYPKIKLRASEDTLEEFYNWATKMNLSVTEEKNNVLSILKELNLTTELKDAFIKKLIKGTAEEFLRNHLKFSLVIRDLEQNLNGRFYMN